jgi:hypothetical protein
VFPLARPPGVDWRWATILRHSTGPRPRADRESPRRWARLALPIAGLCLAACTTQTRLPATCFLTAPVVTLFTSTNGSVTQPVLSSGGPLFLSTPTSVVILPILGGAPQVVANAESPSRVESIGEQFYFQALSASDPSALEPPAYPSPQLFWGSFGLPGFTTIAGLGAFSPITADASSIYLLSGSTLERLPNLGSASMLASDAALLIYDGSVQNDYLYLAAWDLTVGGLTNGVIGRTPIDGTGTLERIVTGIGHPIQIATDETSIYWSEDPPALSGAGPGRLARSNLDGSSPTTLLPKEPISFVASSGRLYLSFGTEIDVMVASGGPTYPVARGLTDAGLLLVADNELIWVDPFSQALSGTAPTLVQAACIP